MIIKLYTLNSQSTPVQTSKNLIPTKTKILKTGVIKYDGSEILKLAEYFSNFCLEYNVDPPVRQILQTLKSQYNTSTIHLLIPKKRD